MSDPRIGSMNESSLHESLKRLYAEPDGVMEAVVDGCVVDIWKNGSVIEIQTGSFGGIRGKLARLLEKRRVMLVYPVAVSRVIQVLDRRRRKVLYKRKSPKRGGVIDVVDEIIRIPDILRHPNFSLEVALTEEEEVRSDDGKGSWRRRGISKVDRRLVDVVRQVRFDEYRDYLMLLPGEMPAQFTNRELAAAMKLPGFKVGRLTYALKKLGLLKVVGKRGNAQVFREA